MSKLQLFTCKWTLAFIWLFTGWTSLFGDPDTGYEILAGANITGIWALLLLTSGACLDFFIGIWLVIGRHTQWCFYCQLITIAIFSVLLSIIAPQYWLHPFGPAIKNLPILVLVWLYYSQIEKGQATKDK